jgi:hypothetical protein
VPVYNFDPQRIHLTIVSPVMVIPRVSGFSPGSAVAVAPATARFTRIDGVRGQVARVRQRLRAGTIGFVLEERSWINAQLELLHTADDAAQSGVCAVMIFDEDGLDLAVSPQAWIVGRPAWQKGNGPGTKAWGLDCARLELFNGGGVPAGQPRIPTTVF